VSSSRAFDELHDAAVWGLLRICHRAADPVEGLAEKVHVAARASSSLIAFTTARAPMGAVLSRTRSYPSPNICFGAAFIISNMINSCSNGTSTNTFLPLICIDQDGHPFV
jgi:hypothetical protein